MLCGFEDCRGKGLGYVRLTIGNLAPTKSAKGYPLETAHVESSEIDLHDGDVVDDGS